MAPTTIIVVEDDVPIALLVKDTLRRAGFRVLSAHTLREARARISRAAPALIVLDRMLPDGEGLDLCRELRSRETTRKIPILFLSAYAAAIDKITGLEMGGDDYLGKPFDCDELLARVNAIIRRSQISASSPRATLTHKGIALDTKSHECAIDGTPVHLWPKEYEVLKVLLANINVVVSKECLAEQVWGRAYMPTSRTIEITIQRLRSKLGNKACLLETVKGYGFKLKKE